MLFDPFFFIGYKGGRELAVGDKRFERFELSFKIKFVDVFSLYGILFFDDFNRP